MMHAPKTVKSPTATKRFRTREIWHYATHPVGFGGHRHADASGMTWTGFLASFLLIALLLFVLLWVFAPFTIGFAEAVRISANGGFAGIGDWALSYVTGYALSGWAYVKTIWSASIRPMAICVVSIYLGLWLWVALSAFLKGRGQ